MGGLGVPLPSVPTSLDELIDRAAIGDVVHGYATGVDRRDWALYRSIFTDRLDVDFTSWAGIRETMDADQWVAMVRATLAPFDATEHRLSNLVVTLDGDRACCVAQMNARHMLDGRFQILGGFYTHQLVRTADGWRIAGCTLMITWEEGDRALFDEARERGPRARVDVGLAGI